MYHLTRHKYWFFGISLAIILPGVLALIVWHLNLGIDFTNGSQVQFRFANTSVTQSGLKQVFTSAGAQDVQIFASKSLSDTIPPSQYAYISFSRSIGTDEVSAVTARLQSAKAGLPSVTVDRTYYLVEYPNSKTQTALVVVHFSKAVKASAITAALQNLPATSAAPVTESTTATASSTPATSATPSSTASATKTPTATATATPSATQTAGQSTTPATTATFPVSVTNVQLGSNQLTYEVDTQTSVNTSTSVGGKTLDLNKLLYALQAKYGPAYIQTSDTVGPSIAAETTRNAFFAVLAASAFILAYIFFAFRNVGSWARRFRFGASAIIALLHDVLVVLGLWAIFGHFFDFKVDSLFLTAVLTVIGFSVHDTIVVFDRLRENLRRRTSETFETVVDASLVQTMSRSLNTSLTVLFTLAALTLFGGASIQSFTLALLIGIASGTYSSIFNASMILVVWENREYRNWFRRKPRPVARPAAPARRELAETRA